MLRDESFLEQVALRAGSKTNTISASDTVTKVSMELPAPSIVQKFVGATLKVDQTITWNSANADGTHSNLVEVKIPGMPVRMSATGTVRADQDGTVVTYEGELQVSIPLVGKKIETEAEPRLIRALDLQAEVGKEWLTQAK